MKLVVIRHAIAEDQDAWTATGEPEERRPITDEGRKKMKKAARGLQRLVEHIDLLATSPLTRAVQTAEIVGRSYEALAVVVNDALRPDQAFQQFLHWLGSLDEPGTVAVVGHEPHLSGLVSWLLTNSNRNVLALKKGGACLLQLDKGAAPGHAQLQWLLTPEQLRAVR